MTRRRSTAATRPIPTLLAHGIRGWRPEMRCAGCGHVESQCDGSQARCRVVIAGPAFEADVTQEFSLSGEELADLRWAELAGVTGGR